MIRLPTTFWVILVIGVVMLRDDRELVEECIDVSNGRSLRGRVQERVWLNEVGEFGGLYRHCLRYPLREVLHDGIDRTSEFRRSSGGITLASMLLDEAHVS